MVQEKKSDENTKASDHLQSSQLISHKLLKALCTQHMTSDTK